MKRLGLATLALLAPAGAAHAGEFSGNISLVSDYVFRGVSLSDGAMAVQGGFDWTDEHFYVGTWGSSLSDGVELDLYAGVTPKTGPITWDFAVLGYFYPGADDEAAELDYLEFMASGTFSLTESFSVRPALYVAPDNYGDTGEATYVEISAAYEMTDEFVFSGTFGSQSVEDPDGPFGAAEEDTYASWNLGVAYFAGGFTLDLRYHDTDIEAGSDIEAYTYGPDSYDSAFVFSISRGL